MAKEDIVIGIKTQVEGNLGKTLDEIGSKVKDVKENLSDVGEKTGKSFKKAADGVGNLSSKIAKGIGVAKLFEAGLGALKDAFMANGAVSEFVGGIMEGLNVLFQDIVNVIVDAVREVSNATNGFEGLSKVMGGVLTIALQGLKTAFFSIKYAILQVMKAWEESPFGDKDPKRIKDLNAEIDKTGKVIGEAATKVAEGGKQIVDNIGKAIDEVAQVVDKGVSNLEKVDVKGAMARGKRLKALEDSAKLAGAQADKLAAKYEREAELQRQLRDDDTKSIGDRIKANNDLADTLDKQEKALKASAEAEVNAAAARKAANNTVENRVAYTQALAKQEQVVADIEGKRSEQKQNKVNLEKEEKAIAQSSIDTQAELAVKQNQFNVSRIKNEEEKLILLKSNLEQEKETELTRLDEKRKSFNLNTQARVDADKEYFLKKQEIENQITSTEDQIAEVRKNKKKESLNQELQAFLQNENEKIRDLAAGSPKRIEAERNILEQQQEFYRLHKDIYFKTDEEYAVKKAELEKQISDNEYQEQQARKQNAIAVSQEVLSTISSLNSSIGTLRDNESKAELVRLQEENNAVLQSEADKVNAIQSGTEDRKKAELNYAKIKEGLDKKLAEQKKKIDKDSFERGKKIAIATALINGAQAVIAALSTPDPTLGIISGIRVAAAIATTAIQVAAIRAQTFEGGSEAPTVSGGDSGGGGGGGQAPTTEAPSTMGIGTVNIASRRQELQFQQVYVVESDIRGVMNRVETIENRSILGS